MTNGEIFLLIDILQAIHAFTNLLTVSPVYVFWVEESYSASPHTEAALCF